ncbi:MAG TPA: hypothetical protein VGN90_05735 [Pyrinomonadaceae bacterium]|jgi:hypothetical protein|nr:hypothetical protein [Pyrinomonadaceae bacterium]
MVQESTDRENKTEPGADSEATSKETLSDIEKNEADTDSKGSEVDAGPSPDGAFDESNENKDAGPM